MSVVASSEPPERGSNRALGVAFASAFAVVGAAAWVRGGAFPAWLFVVSGAFLVAALLTPDVLAPLNKALSKLSKLPPCRFIAGGAYSVARSLVHCFYPLPAHGFRRIVHIVWWNVLLLAAGLLFVAVAGEAYFRINSPFLKKAFSTRFVPEVGYVYEPNMEKRFTNRLDYWTTQRTNSLGFLDREHPDPERAAAGCGVMAFGDSFVDAREVAIKDKFQVRLEEIAKQERPALNVTTAAFGMPGTAQTHQLPLYDRYAPLLSPNLAALVFVSNDYKDNFPPLYVLNDGFDPDKIPYASAKRGADGVIRLVPPHSEGGEFLPNQGRPFWLRVLRNTVSEYSFARWAQAKLGLTLRDNEQFAAWAYEIGGRPAYRSFLDGWSPSDVKRRFRYLGIGLLTEFFVQPELPPAFQEALLFTAFALDEFQRRAERDGAALVILATHTMGPTDNPLFQRLAAMAGERGIPVINQYDYIERVGGNVEDAHFKHDWHWSAQGHQWAAEALMEWLRENPQVCDDE